MDAIPGVAQPVLSLKTLPAEIQEAIKGIKGSPYPALHAGVVQAGSMSILDFFDTVPWLGTGGEWAPWRAFLAALFGLPMSPAELKLYQECTGRVAAPPEPCKEGWMAVGRRGRKSAIAAVIASYTAAYRDHSLYTAPGEPALIPVLSKNKSEAQQIKRYVDAIFEAKELSWMVKESNTEIIRIQWDEKHPGCEIMVKAATLMAGRSRAIPLALLDEVAFFRADESANPDVEIIRGITPGMATVPGALLIGLSSPYARRGVLYDKYKEHFGREGSKVLFWQSGTLVMHPGNPHVEAHVKAEYEADETSAKAEYGAQFRTDVESYIPEELVEAVMVPGRKMLPPVPGKQYVCFFDASGGTSDSMTMAIAHWEPPEAPTPPKPGELEGPQALKPGRAVLDIALESKPPFRPKVVIKEFSVKLKEYGINHVEGDAYAGDWPADSFRDHQITYRTSEDPRSDLYLAFLPLITSEIVELIDSKRMKAQIAGLDRKTGGGGRDRVNHQPGAHDDVCFVAGTMIATPSGDVSIENIEPGMSVLVPGGVATVEAAWRTGRRQVIRRGEIVGTPTHPVLHWGKGAVELRHGVETACRLNLATQIRWTLLKLLSLWESNTGSWERADIISASRNPTRVAKGLRAYMWPFGRSRQARSYREAITFITKIGTALTTTLVIYGAYRLRSIFRCQRMSIAKRCLFTLRESVRSVTSGMEHQRAWRGTTSRPRGTWPTGWPSRGTTSAPNAEQALRAAQLGEQNTAQLFADQGPHGVEGEQDVYNLMVSEQHVYYANGVLVSNCNVVAGACVRAYQFKLMPREAPPPVATTTEEIVKQQRAEWYRRQAKLPGGKKSRRPNRWR